MAETGAESAGLTGGERKVYLALAELGASTANPVIRRTGMQKSTVYFCLDRLVAKGLASYVVKNNRRFFEAAPVPKLADFFEDRKKKLDEQKGEIQRMIKVLLAARPKEVRGARVFEGWEGMETAFEDILKTLKPGDEYHVLGVTASDPVLERFRRFAGRFHARRAGRRIKAKMLLSEKVRQTLGKDREKDRFTEVRYIPEEYSMPTTANIYANKTLILLLAEEPTAFVIESKEVAESFRNYFKLLWSEETRVYHGYEGIQFLMEEMLEDDSEGRFIGGRGQVPVRMPEYWKDFAVRAAAKGFKWKILGHPEIIGTPIMREKFVEIRMLPKLATGPLVIWIWGNKVANLIWAEEPIAFVVENKELAESYKEYFDWLWTEKTRVYHGLDGIKMLMEEALKEDQTRILGGRGMIPVRMPDYFWKDYAPRAEAKGFKWRILGHPDIKKTPIMKGKFVHVRLLPKLAIGPMVIWILGNKVANVMFTKTPVAFVIENEEIARSYKEYFECLWKQAEVLKA